jgi:hypothetical protein
MNDKSKNAVPVSVEEVWARFCEGENGAMDYFIIGSRAGLVRLKEHIESAIEKGESVIVDEPGIAFAGIRVEEDAGPEGEMGWKEKAVSAGCLGLLIAILLLAVWGFASLFGL